MSAAVRPMSTKCDTTNSCGTEVATIVGLPIVVMVVMDLAAGALIFR